MTILSIPSVAAQNSFGTLIDKAQRQMVSVTRRGRVAALVMSPEVLRDYVDGQFAAQAEAEGFAPPDEVTSFLSSLHDA